MEKCDWGTQIRIQKGIDTQKIRCSIGVALGGASVRTSSLRKSTNPRQQDRGRERPRKKQPPSTRRPSYFLLLLLLIADGFSPLLLLLLHVEGMRRQQRCRGLRNNHHRNDDPASGRRRQRGNSDAFDEQRRRKQLIADFGGGGLGRSRISSVRKSGSERIGNNKKHHMDRGGGKDESKALRGAPVSSGTPV